MDTGRQRHENDSVSANAGHLERFIDLLKQYHVKAYICGHTHDSSVVKVKGIWQADSGHARGGGDKGAPSTFLKFRVSDVQAWVDVYRADPDGVKYQLRKTVELE
jgi:predicted phosphodiesterase